MTPEQDAICRAFAVRPAMVGLKQLPRQTRLRLWFNHRIDGVALWLVDHRHQRAAIALWRACRMW